MLVRPKDQIKYPGRPWYLQLLEETQHYYVVKEGCEVVAKSKEDWEPVLMPTWEEIHRGEFEDSEANYTVVVYKRKKLT